MRGYRRKPHNFYTYYKDQYDLLGQTEEETLVEFDNLIQKYSPAGTMLPLKELVVPMEVILCHIASNSNSIQMFLSENGKNDFQKNLSDILPSLCGSLKTPGTTVRPKNGF
jgi:hypothetical protein